MDRYREYFAQARNASPIIFDLDGDGVETRPVATGTYFVHDADGFAEETGWVGSEDGFLVWDRNGDGRISDGTELFGDQTLLTTGLRAANGFEALAEWDGNADGKIDSLDGVWANLKVWIDSNGDGYDATGEVLTLSAAGIQSINTASAGSNYVDAQGNAYRQVGTFSKANGTTATATDVWFQTDRMISVAEQWLAVPDEIGALPRLMGLGIVRDLDQAMVRDTGGSLKSAVQSFIAQTDPLQRTALLEQILYQWTGSDGIDPTSRGPNLDARKVAYTAFSSCITRSAWT